MRGQQTARTAEYAPEDRGGQEREGRGRRGRQGPGMRQGARRGKGEKGADRGDSGHGPNARSTSRCRGRLHRSVRRCGRRRRGRRAAGRRRGTRRWRTWSASAVASSPQSRGQTPSTGLGWGQGREKWSARVDRRGWEGCTADNPVVRRREGRGRQDRAAQQQQGATDSGRQGKRLGASEADKQAARRRAGMCS